MSNKKAKKGRQALFLTPHMGPTKITKETPGIKIEVIPEDEIEGPTYDDFASGDDVADRQMVDEMNERRNGGDIWAWFSAHVRVTFGEFKSSQYLGACSYSDEADFRQGGYFDDMVAEAIDDINQQIAKAAHLAACTHCQAVNAGALPHPIA
jgi:hypothetical protein